MLIHVKSGKQTDRNDGLEQNQNVCSAHQQKLRLLLVRTQLLNIGLKIGLSGIWIKFTRMIVIMKADNNFNVFRLASLTEEVRKSTSSARVI